MWMFSVFLLFSWTVLRSNNKSMILSVGADSGSFDQSNNSHIKRCNWAIKVKIINMILNIILCINCCICVDFHGNYVLSFGAVWRQVWGYRWKVLKHTWWQDYSEKRNWGMKKNCVCEGTLSWCVFLVTPYPDLWPLSVLASTVVSDLKPCCGERWRVGKR